MFPDSYTFPRKPEGTRVHLVVSTPNVPDLLNRVFDLHEEVTLGLMESVKIKEPCVRASNLSVEVETRGAVRVAGPAFRFVMEPTATPETWLVLGTRE